MTFFVFTDGIMGRDAHAIITIIHRGNEKMYQVNIKEDGITVDVIQHKLCSEDISDVETMLTAIVGARLNIPNLILMPMGNHTYNVFHVISIHTQVSVTEIGKGDK